MAAHASLEDALADGLPTGSIKQQFISYRFVKTQQGLVNYLNKRYGKDTYEVKVRPLQFTTHAMKATAQQPII